MTPSPRWYEHWFLKAMAAESNNQIGIAIRNIDRAEKHTLDVDELKYLKIWRDRLKRMIA